MKATDRSHADTAAATATATATTTAERWSIDAGEAATATLEIPADAHRERRFEIACSATVAVPADGRDGAAWIQLTVLANGARQWQRRTTAHSPGAWDGLDVRFDRTVPPGQGLRLAASLECSGAQRRSLTIEADEV
jgi:hypothetical protein